WTPTKDGVEQYLNPANLIPIDRWALARLNSLVRTVTDAFEAYDVTTAGRAIEDFVDELSNWYVRRNRRRFWKSEHDSDKQAAYATLYTCLLTVAKLAAPFVPFVAEAIYRNLVGLESHEGQTDAPESVHLAAWPQVNEALLEERLVADTEVLLKAVSVGRAARRAAGIKVRQPLRELWVRAPTPA
ncbi:MAG: class I tRNA ligase family protein, partial [Candidatus Kryptonium sp.]|nr:class I tRNA ligase family protein [Candidatus Kryptonium sp.]